MAFKYGVLTRIFSMFFHLPVYHEVIDFLPLCSILHSVIIAKASVNFIEYIIKLLQEDGDDVLKKIINDQNHLQRVNTFIFHFMLIFMTECHFSNTVYMYFKI